MASGGKSIVYIHQLAFHFKETLSSLPNYLYQYGLVTTYVLLFCFNRSFPITVIYCDAYVVSGLVSGIPSGSPVSFDFFLSFSEEPHMPSNAFMLKVCVDPTSHSRTGHVRAFGTNTHRILETLLA